MRPLCLQPNHARCSFPPTSTAFSSPLPLLLLLLLLSFGEAGQKMPQSAIRIRYRIFSIFPKSSTLLTFVMVMVVGPGRMTRASAWAGGGIFIVLGSIMYKAAAVEVLNWGFYWAAGCLWEGRVLCGGDGGSFFMSKVEAGSNFGWATALEIDPFCCSWFFLGGGGGLWGVFWLGHGCWWEDRGPCGNDSGGVVFFCRYLAVVGRLEREREEGRRGPYYSSSI